MQDKTEEFFMQRLRTPSAGFNSPLLDYPASELIRRAMFGTKFFHFWPLVQTLGCGQTVGSP